MNNGPDAAMNALSRAAKTILQYPIPAALAAGGLVLLLVNQLIRKAKSAPVSSQVDQVSRKVRNLGADAQDRAEQAGSQVENLSKKARELAAEAQERAEQAGSQVENLSKKARELAVEAQERAEHLGSQVQDTVQVASQDIADTAQKIADRVKSAKN